MTTLAVCIRRRGDLSRAAFSAYWRDTHGPLIRSCPEFTRHLASYTQYHAIDGDSDIARMFGISGEYDGVALLRFHDAEAMRQAFAEPAYLERVRPDEPRFVDLEASLSMIVQPVEVV